MSEIWKDVKGYERRYQISNCGNARSCDMDVICRGGKKRRVNGKLLNKRINPINKYVQYVLCLDGEKKYIYAHRMVADAFIPNPLRKETVNHIDENKLNNCVENLEWATQRENNCHNNMPMRRAATRRANYKPSSTDTPVIYLDGRKKEAKAIL